MSADTADVVGRDEEVAAAVAFLESTETLPGVLLLSGREIGREIEPEMIA